MSLAQGVRPALFKKPPFYLRVVGIVFYFALTSAPSFAQISDAASQQIAAVLAFKKTFSPAEQKMSSNLVLLSRRARHMPLGNLAKFINEGKPDAQGRIKVTIGADLSPSLMSSRVMRNITQGEGQIPQQDAREGRIGGHVHPADLLELAGHADVQFIREADEYTTNAGSVTSQGYVSHTANKVNALGITGAGVTVGVLSDSATPARVAALIASGDLPADVIVVPGQSGGAGADEGAAMMEIVHDMAPGAKLVFATADPTQAQMAANIHTLRFTYHCDIIVDDVTYFAEGAFQDGTIAKAVNEVTNDGALYFSAAANSGNLTSGTSGTWEGDFVNGGPVVSGPISAIGETGSFHSFGTQLFDRLTSPGTGFISLKWSDPLAGSSNDYDLFVLNSTGAAVKGFSAAAQTGTQDPLELIGPGTNCGTTTASGYCPAAGDEIVVVLFDGSTRALRVDTNRATLQIGTAGSTFGHNAGLNTISMAATYWNSAKTGTKPFTGFENPIETFSSDGPRKIFFQPDGTAITPGNFLFGTNGGTTLQKPDATAADGVNTKTPGFLPFFGTSAAAPHAAGIAALVKSARPSLTNTQIKAILLNTTLDTMAPGIDRDSGYGILMALPAVQAALALP
jgi:hypothetical protein